MSERLEMEAYQKAYKQARLHRVNWGLTIAFGIPTLCGILCATSAEGAPGANWAMMLFIAGGAFFFGCWYAFSKPTAAEIIKYGG